MQACLTEIGTSLSTLLKSPLDASLSGMTCTGLQKLAISQKKKKKNKPCLLISIDLIADVVGTRFGVAAADLGCVKAEESTRVVVQEQLQGPRLQEVACMMQLCDLCYGPALVTPAFLQQQSLPSAKQVCLSAKNKSAFRDNQPAVLQQ